MARASSAAERATAVNAHPLYLEWKPEWAKLLDVYEGAGGFLDEARPYLWAHPREWLDHTIKDPVTGERSVNPTPSRVSPKLKTRRRMARYENVANTVVEAYRGALFREEAQRAFAKDGVKDRKIQDFWTNADGRGHSLTDCMRSGWTAGAVFGYSVLVLDRAANAPTAETTEATGPRATSPSLADAKTPILRLYSPLDLIDWLIDDLGELTAVKLLEPEPRTSLDAKALPTRFRVRVIDAHTWTLYDSSNNRIDGGPHGFGRLPVVLLYARRRTLIPVIGQSLLHDPQLYIDLYNLISECRELLRNQTFGILNVPLGESGNIEAAQQMIADSGTQSVLFSAHPGQYLSPDAQNVSAYHAEMDRLLRTIYRLTALPWDSDAKAVESAESRSIKRSDLHQVLSGFADELESTEERLCELVYRGIFGDTWQREYDRDEPYISYPEQFDVSSIEEAVAACDAAIRLELGETYVKASKKRTARRLVPGLSPAQQKTADDEIAAQPVETSQERHERQLEVAMARFQRPDEGPPKTPDQAEEAA